MLFSGDSERGYVSQVAGRSDWWFGGFPPWRSQPRVTGSKELTWGSVLGRFRPATIRVRDDSSLVGVNAGAWSRSVPGSCPACQEAHGTAQAYERRSPPAVRRVPKARRGLPALFPQAPRLAESTCCAAKSVPLIFCSFSIAAKTEWEGQCKWVENATT